MMSSVNDIIYNSDGIIDVSKINSVINEDDVTYSDGILLYNPYNPLNKEITLNDVQSILNEYGIQANVNNIELYKRAFIHRSYTKRPRLENEKSNIKIAEQPENCISLKTKSNERLEFVGDGVLELITKYYLYRRFPKEDEGFMTEKKIALVKNEHIGKLAFNMRLNKWFIMSKNTEDKNTRNNLKKLGCLFEAFIGALFLDFNKIDINDEHGWFKNTFICGPGFQMAQIFIENVFEKFVDWQQIISCDDNFKNILQVKIQKMFRTTPSYIEISRDIEKGYTMGVYLCLGKPIHSVDLNDAVKYSDFGSFSAIKEEFDKKTHVFVQLGIGTHIVKKKAEQSACEEALAVINEDIN
jgi:dsRNA-specific ribonuclease